MSLNRTSLGLRSPQRRPTVVGAEYSPFSKGAGQLQDITYDPNFTTSCQSPVQGSPAQARTMKDYEEQLSALRKENFNLKLSVYFLEERLYTSNPPMSQDNLLKKNIELNVTLESLRRDVSEKQELLCAAGRALELLESSAARKEAELLSQISSIENELHILRNTQYGDDEISLAPEMIDDITTGVDDSVALYAAAFNIQPTPAEVQALQKKTYNKNDTPCECRQLKALLTIEKENAETLRNTVAARELVIAEMKQQIQAIENTKLTTSKNVSLAEKKIVENSEEDNTESHQLERLQQENLNACQMIQGCLVRIKQMDRENKKIKKTLLDKDDLISKLQTAESSLDSAALIKKYKDMLDVRNNMIINLESQLKNSSALKDHNSSKLSSMSDEKEYNCVKSHLEKKINILRESMCIQPEPVITNGNQLSNNIDMKKDQINIQEMLVKRLQELGYFLDSLLSHKCVLGEEKRRKVENLLEQTIELPLGLRLDKNASQLLEESFLDTTFGVPSQSFKLEDLTTVFGHHLSLNDTFGSNKVVKYKYLEDTLQKGESDKEDMVKNQAIQIQNLKKQIMIIKASCVCNNVCVEHSEENQSSSNLRSSCCEYNKLLSRRNKGKMNKIHLNTTWNGFDGSQVDQSESECWSEPDRSVSLARMGGPLEESKEVISSEEEVYSQRLTNNSNILQNSLNDNKLSENRDQIRLLLEEKSIIERSLSEANSKIKNLESNIETNKILHAAEIQKKQAEIDSLVKKLKDTETDLNQQLVMFVDNVTKLKYEKVNIEEELRTTSNKLSEAESIIVNDKREHEEKQSMLRKELKDITDKIDSEWVSRVRYEALRRELDNAALQASQATLDRTLASENKVRSDAESERYRIMLRDEQLRVSELENLNAELQNRLVRLETWHTSTNRALSSSGHASDTSPQATSPDHSIEGDRLSMQEFIEAGPPSEKYGPRDLASENIILREKLEQTQRALHHLKNNKIPPNVQRAFCQEIHKTASILRQARDNFNYNS